MSNPLDRFSQSEAENMQARKILSSDDELTIQNYEIALRYALDMIFVLQQIDRKMDQIKGIADIIVEIEGKIEEMKYD